MTFVVNHKLQAQFARTIELAQNAARQDRVGHGFNQQMNQFLDSLAFLAYEIESLIFRIDLYQTGDSMQSSRI